MAQYDQNSAAILPLPEAYREPSDELLSTLLAATFLLGLPASRAIGHGLSGDDGRLPLDQLPVAAARAGLDAQRRKVKFRDLNAALLPIILELRDGQMALIAELNPEQGALIFEASHPDTFRRSDLADLQSTYTGQAIVLKAVYDDPSRAVEAGASAKSHWFWSSLRPLLPSYFQVILAAAVVNIFGLAAPLFIMNVYDRVLPNEAFTTLWALAAGIGLAVVFDFIFRSLRAYLVGHAGRRADVVLAGRLFRHIMDLDLSARPERAGSFVGHIKSYELVREFFASSTLAQLTDFVFIWLFIALIYLIGGPLAYVPAAAVLVTLIFCALVQRPMLKIVTETHADAAHHQSLLLEAVQALETVKTTNAQSDMTRRWELATTHHAGSRERLQMLSSLASNVTSMVQQSVTVGMVILGVYLFSEAQISSGALIASVMLAGRAIGPLAMITSMLTRLQYALHAYRTLDQIMAIPEEVVSRSGQTAKRITSATIDLNGAGLSYPGSGTPALADLNLRITSGERIGVIGKIGSGKSSLGRLLAGLHAPTSGSIWIDGLDSRQYPPAEIRRAFCYVAQDASLVYGSLRDNITLGQKWIDDDAVMQAIACVGLAPLVHRHPQRLHLPVGENGAFLSVGQRRAVTLARAFLAKPPLLFLDEPTGNMDQQLEMAFVRNLRRTLTTDQTLVVATHRTPPLELVDRLIVLDAGRVVADGPRDKILTELRKSARPTTSKSGARRSVPAKPEPTPLPQPRDLEPAIEKSVLPG